LGRGSRQSIANMPLSYRFESWQYRVSDGGVLARTTRFQQHP
jgi:hypothetical protein